MKTIQTLLIVFFLNGITLNGQVAIKQSVYGQNAWFIINSNNPPTDLDTLWQYIAASGVKYVRIGGIDANFNPLYNFDLSLNITGNAAKLKHLIDGMRAYGIEPIIQVGYNPVCSSIGTLGGVSFTGPNDQATIAANLVDFLNNRIPPVNHVLTA